MSTRLCFYQSHPGFGRSIPSVFYLGPPISLTHTGQEGDLARFYQQDTYKSSSTVSQAPSIMLALVLAFALAFVDATLIRSDECPPQPFLFQMDSHNHTLQAEPSDVAYVHCLQL
jgi:hypothetical protein